MSAAASRAASVASKAGQSIAKNAKKADAVVNEAGSKGNQSVLNKEARKNPELYILATIMTGAFGMAGYYFGSKPTGGASEAPTSIAEGSMPWQTESTGGGSDEHFKYQYHPGGDKSKPVKDAPSALHSVIVPNVTLPKSVHDQFNKYGKDGF